MNVVNCPKCSTIMADFGEAHVCPKCNPVTTRIMEQVNIVTAESRLPLLREISDLNFKLGMATGALEGILFNNIDDALKVRIQEVLKRLK